MRVWILGFVVGIGLLVALGVQIDHNIEARAQRQQFDYFLNVELPQLYDL